LAEGRERSEKEAQKQASSERLRLFFKRLNTGNDEEILSRKEQVDDYEQRIADLESELARMEAEHSRQSRRSRNSSGETLMIEQSCISGFDIAEGLATCQTTEGSLEASSQLAAREDRPQGASLRRKVLLALFALGLGACLLKYPFW